MEPLEPQKVPVYITAPSDHQATNIKLTGKNSDRDQSTDIDGSLCLVLKVMRSKQPADLLLRHVWRLHGTPQPILPDRGSIFMSQIIKAIDRHHGIRL